MTPRLSRALLVSLAIAGGVLAVVRAQPPQPGPPQAYYVVQYDGPIQEVWKTDLLAAGAEILDYIPDFAFKVRLARSEASRVARLPGVVSIDGVAPERKFARGLLRTGTRGYLVLIERGADAAAAEAAIAATGATVLRRDSARLFVAADATVLDAIAALADVASIENLPLYEKHNEFGAGVVTGANLAHAAGFDGSTQIVAIADTGLGDGTVAGGHTDLPPSRIAAIFNWPGGPSGCFSAVVDDGAMDVDSGHGTHVVTTAVGGGGADGAGRGSAPGARLVFQAIENWAQPSLLCRILYGLPDGYYLTGIPADLRDLFQQAYDAGARVHSSSWGSAASGAYTAAAASADEFVWTRRDMTLTMSAGNSGIDANLDGVVDGSSITSPATAKNVITVGASENDRQGRWDCDAALAYTECAARGGRNALFTYGEAFPGRFGVNPLKDDVSAGNAGQMAAFSSRGPAADGRIKPDVLAPGTWMLSGYSGLFREQYDPAPNPVSGRYQYDGWGDPLNPAYKYMGGTSMSAPLVAGAAAVVRDYYERTHGHHASAALVKATLINSAVDLPDENNDGVDDNAYPIPNIHEGWGRIDLASATGRSREFFDEDVPLSTGVQAAWGVPASAGGAPLMITLVWTDSPASAAADRTLVNDLDLKVMAPDGSLYAGNAFAGGWSVPGRTPDRVNNVENVYVAAPLPGEWTVIVSAFNVPMGPQPFALLIDGAAGTAVPQDPPLPLPIVSVTADPATASEAGPVAGAFRISRTGDTSAALRIGYVLSGTATPGIDYAALPAEAVIPAGSSTAFLLVEPTDDEHFEPDESVLLSLAVDDTYDVGAPHSATVMIVSDDEPSDLIVTAVSAPAAAVPGAMVTLSDTTKNQGAGAAAPSETGFYLSSNLQLDAADLFLGSRPVTRLEPGATESSAVDLPIPESIAGAYYIIAKADWNGVVAESQEGNNLRTSSIVRIGSDLVVPAASAPTSAAAGATVLVEDTTKNQGAAPAGVSSTGFYLSTNSALDAADVPLGRRAVSALAAGSTDTASTALTIPESTPGGAYYILARADDEADVPEAHEGNNVKSAGVIRIGPDLTVASVAAPALAAAGSTIAVTDTTTNRGEGASPASTTGYYFAKSSLPKATDPLRASRQVPALDAGASHTGGAALTVPHDTAPGTYFIVAKADVEETVAEGHEGNNTKATSIKVGPDLTVPSVVAPASGGAGRPMSIAETVRNAGLDPAGATTVRIYLSANSSVDSSDALLGSRAVPPLAGESSSSSTTAVVVPEGAPTGTYYVLVQVDPDNAVEEFTEINNVGRSAAIRIGPDLTVPSLSGPSSAVAGSTITVTDTTANGGGGHAPASVTSFYLSTNSTFDSSDILLGSRAIPTLDPGASEIGSTTLALPLALEARTYYIIAVADAPGEIAETYENNNRRVVGLKITLPSGAVN